MILPAPALSRLDERLISKAKRLSGFTQCLRAYLPPECEGHYQVAAIRQRTLVLVTDSPVWTTRLRQLGPRILDILHDAGHGEIQHINVSSRINVKPVAAPKKARVKRKLSESARKHIARSAEGIADDSLRQALQHLARRK